MREILYSGMRTVSITWMTPLEHLMSALTTFEELRKRLPSVTLSAIFFLFRAVALVSLTACDEATLPATTWYVRMSLSFPLFSGLRSISSVPLGSFLNASSEGANTVNGPSPFSASTSPAAFNAATSVGNCFELTAVSTILEAFWTLTIF